jgi:hypothetical protein
MLTQWTCGRSTLATAFAIPELKTPKCRVGYGEPGLGQQSEFPTAGGPSVRIGGDATKAIPLRQ